MSSPNPQTVSLTRAMHARGALAEGVAYIGSAAVLDKMHRSKVGGARTLFVFHRACRRLEPD